MTIKRNFYIENFLTKHPYSGRFKAVSKKEHKLKKKPLNGFPSKTSIDEQPNDHVCGSTGN